MPVCSRIRLPMRTVITALMIAVVFFIPHSGAADQPDRSVYLDGGVSKIGVILCHGRGKHPTWKVVDPLRKAIHEQLGYHTLSLQLPAHRKSWKSYAEDFPKAYEQIEAGIACLKKDKKVDQIYLMGHSMGSRMATAYLADTPRSPVVGFIGVGIRNGGGRPLDSNANLRLVNIPVLDVYGDGGDWKDLDHAVARSGMVSSTYRQVLIPRANHTFDFHEKEMVKAVVDWLNGRN